MTRKTSQKRSLLDEVRSALAAKPGRGRSGHSTLYRQMRRQHDALMEVFAETPPIWSVLAEKFAEQGLTDATDKPASAEVARRTWYRVRRDVARARAKRSTQPALHPALDSYSTGAPDALPIAPAEAQAKPKLDLRPSVRRTQPDPASSKDAGPNKLPDPVFE